MLNAEQKDSLLLSQFVFDNDTPALLIATIQFLAAILTEITSIVLLVGQRDHISVIANFIVIKVISDVDNIYLNGTNDVTLQKVTSGDDW